MSISTNSSKEDSGIERKSSRFGLYAILLALVTVLAAIMRLHSLTAKSFWLDEGFSIGFARLSWPQFLHTIWSGRTVWFGEIYMLLYFFLLRLWMTFGNSEGFVRGLSVLFSVATIPIIYFLGARLFGRRAGLLAAALLAVNAYHIRYAQEARGYAMLVFFAVLATWLFARNLQEPSSAHWGMYAVVCALTTYSHFFGALLVPAHAISLLSWERDKIPWRKFLGSLLAYGAMIIPIMIFLSGLGRSGEPISWIPPLQPDSLLVLGVDFTGVYGSTLLALDVLAIGIAALGAARTRMSTEHTNYAWGYTLLFAWLVTPVVITLTVSLVKPIFLPRYLSLCIPALLLLVAVGIGRLRPAVLAWGLFIAISACSVLGDLRYYQSDFEMQRQDWRALTSYVYDHSKPGDSIFFCDPGGEPPFEYYSWLRNSASLRPKTLRSQLREDGNGPIPTDLKLDGLVDVPGTNFRIQPPDGGRVWLVLMSLSGSMQEYQRGVAVTNWISIGRQRVDERDFTPLKVILFERSANSLPATGDQPFTTNLYRHRTIQLR